MIIQPNRKNPLSRILDFARYALISASLMIIAAVAQQSDLFKFTLAWEETPGAADYRATDTNGEPVFIWYFVRHATEITSTNWQVVAVTTNHTGGVTVSNLSTRTPHFFYVTASNFFLESDRSEFLSVPALTGTNSQPKNTRFVL